MSIHTTQWRGHVTPFHNKDELAIVADYDESTGHLIKLDLGDGSYFHRLQTAIELSRIAPLS